MRIGILSDTHGLLRPEVLGRLEGSDRILHAGDVGDAGILHRLEAIAPVTAVRGNTDGGSALSNLPHTVEGDVDGFPFAMVHRREEIPARWLEGGPRLVVFGHSHRPELEWRGSCLLLNPGACGHRRFRLPLTIATVTVLDGNRLLPEIYAVEDLDGSRCTPQNSGNGA